MASYDKGAAHASITGLIAPPRQQVLKTIHDDEIVEDVSGMVPAVIGLAIHKLLAQANEGDSVSEQRLYVTLAGWVISGAFDLYHNETIDDYKYTGINSVMYGKRKTEWDQQLNGYAYLAHVAGLKVKELRVTAILSDWSRSRARAGGGYPAKEIMRIPIPLWDLDFTEKWLIERVQLHQAAFAHGLPECTPEERWSRGGEWAVTKGKRAHSLHKTQAEAEVESKKKPGTFVEERPGGSMRCMEYCSVRPFCTQAQRLAIVEGWKTKEE